MNETFTEIADIRNKDVSELADIIKKDWTTNGKQVYFGALPYLEAMFSMVTINDAFGADSGKSIIAYFLGNATTWRGNVARQVKAELNRRLALKSQF